jgi:hypothetical protein
MGEEDWEYDVDDGDAGGDSTLRMDDAFRRRGKVSPAPSARPACGLR